MEITIGNMTGEVVTQTEGEIKTIEALCSQHGQVGRPKFAVVVPRLVLHITFKTAIDDTNRIRRLLN